MQEFDPIRNYFRSKNDIGYVPRSQATQKDYDRIGFKSGLEVHQQLDTKKKLFCHCPAGKFHRHDDYDAEIIRHMRPTLSELGEYDGTALMEFKTRKEITYRLKNDSACTYEIDDTPPFKINQEALEIALEISLLSKLNVVGEVHITRKQYLDGSIPTGFQRTAILGVEGEIQLKNKKLRLIQLSIEEDSCREISDVGHKRLYKTDRLGMPLIETVTYPDCFNPDELQEAAEYIRFLNRSTGKVRIGAGAGREDVNVSCEGGTRVEIKGVAHNKWIPELSHNEAFRQWALLNIRKELLEKISSLEDWKINHSEIKLQELGFESETIEFAEEQGWKVQAVNLPGFLGALSHFTQPGQSFANEISDRLKVIACIEKPNMIHSEDLTPIIEPYLISYVKHKLKAHAKDAQIIFWGPEEDIETALEVIEERCKMALDGIPPETRKSFADGTTIFERVLPGADRMYPDTDSAPIPLSEEYIDSLSKNLPMDIFKRYEQLQKWNIPADTYTYLLRNNLIPIIEEIVSLEINPKYIGCLLGHFFKNLEGKKQAHPEFQYSKLIEVFRFLKKKQLDPEISKLIIPVIYEHPNMELESVLASLHYKPASLDELCAPVDYLYHKYEEIGGNGESTKAVHWIMGQLRKQALGNVRLHDLKKRLEEKVN